MNADDFILFIKCMGMLGSAHEGEAANARAICNKLLAKYKLTWADVPNLKAQASDQSAGKKAEDENAAQWHAERARDAAEQARAEEVAGRAHKTAAEAQARAATAQKKRSGHRNVVMFTYIGALAIFGVIKHMIDTTPSPKPADPWAIGHVDPLPKLTQTLTPNSFNRFDTQAQTSSAQPSQTADEAAAHEAYEDPPERSPAEPSGQGAAVEAQKEPPGLGHWAASEIQSAPQVVAANEQGKCASVPMSGRVDRVYSSPPPGWRCGNHTFCDAAGNEGLSCEPETPAEDQCTPAALALREAGSSNTCAVLNKLAQKECVVTLVRDYKGQKKGGSFQAAKYNQLANGDLEICSHSSGCVPKQIVKSITACPNGIPTYPQQTSPEPAKSSYPYEVKVNPPVCETVIVSRVFPHAKECDGEPHQPGNPEDGDAWWCFGAGSGGIEYVGGKGQSGEYAYVPAMENSRPGDRVVLCLVSYMANCPPGDDRGKFFTALNLRTHGRWRKPNSLHSCGGA